MVDQQYDFKFSLLGFSELDFCENSIENVKIASKFAFFAPKSKKNAKIGIVIETTGMADPAPIAQTFFVDDDVQKFEKNVKNIKFGCFSAPKLMKISTF